MEEKKEFNIDEELNRLEEINNKLRDPEISLNDSLKLYNEGTLLAAKCQEHLTGVEKELQILNGEAQV